MTEWIYRKVAADEDLQILLQLPGCDFGLVAPSAWPFNWNYSRTNPPRDATGRKYRISGDDWVRIEILLDVLLPIANRYGKSSAAISLNWVICKGAVPLPSVGNVGQVEDCVEALGWQLRDEDERLLDVAGYEISLNAKTNAGKLMVQLGRLPLMMILLSLFISILAAGVLIYRG